MAVLHNQTLLELFKAEKIEFLSIKIYRESRCLPKDVISLPPNEKLQTNFESKSTVLIYPQLRSDFKLTKNFAICIICVVFVFIFIFILISCSITEAWDIHRDELSYII